MLRLLLTTVAVAVASGLLLANEVRGQDKAGCPKDSTVLTQTGSTAVVRRASRGVVACSRHSPASVVLTEEYFERLFLGPALAVKRNRVAYAVVFFDDPDEAFETTSVFQVDMDRKTTDGTTVDNPIEYAAGPLGSNVRVTRIVLRSDGAMAWIACSSHHFPPAARVSRGGECTGPGRRSYVITVSATGRRRQVTSGVTVDPQYLRLASGGIVLFRISGQRRSTRLF